MRLVWAAAALRDLQAAREFIGPDNPAAARAQLALVFAAARRIAAFPGLGRPGRVPETREMAVPRTPYILGYRVRADALIVLRVLHGRRQWPDSLG